MQTMNAEIAPERRQLRRENSARTTWQVLNDLRVNRPDIWDKATVVGTWVWVDFDAPPPKEDREYLLDAGFHWNHKRKAWQHACGAWTAHSTGDPRWKYMSAPAREFADEPAQATA